MSAQAVTMWRVLCDFPGCKSSAQDGGDYHAWSEADRAMEEADDCGWHRGGDDLDAIYCDGHHAAWASDFESDEPGWDFGVTIGWDRPYPLLILNDFGSGDGEAFLVADEAAACALLDRLAS